MEEHGATEEGKWWVGAIMFHCVPVQNSQEKKE